MPYDIRVNFIGTAELQAAFAGLPDRIKKKAMRRGMTKAGRILAQEAKQRAPRETGLLQQSMGSRVYVTRAGGYAAAVGPRTGFRRPVVKIRRGRRAGSFRKATKREIAAGGFGKGDYRDPAKYGHLVEKGFRLVRGGKLPRTIGAKFLAKLGIRKAGHVIGHVAARPFLGPALAAVKDRLLELIAEECAAELTMSGMSGAGG
jgi:HK97 gp10 family phage protein